ncbi:MAG: MmcQ/YjbR family DNA-binding protein [Ignavibacteriaceae bacterium]|nr:MmcQ/YjbR family DNA-binding protein [Ignavibacteriaceae bacterium]
MNLEQVREYCLSKKGVTESLPFDEDTPVYKVMNKMFLLANLVPPYSINIKCDPEKAVELREKHDDVIPGYHMNKTHWNTVYIDTNIPDKLLYNWIDNSYDLIVKGLKKKDREELERM